MNSLNHPLELFDHKLNNRLWMSAVHKILISLPFERLRISCTARKQDTKETIDPWCPYQLNTALLHMLFYNEVKPFFGPFIFHSFQYKIWWGESNIPKLITGSRYGSANTQQTIWDKLLAYFLKLIVSSVRFPLVCKFHTTHKNR